METPIEFDRNYSAIPHMAELEEIEGGGKSYFPEVKTGKLAMVRAYAEANAIRLAALAILPARIMFFAARLGQLNQVVAQRDWQMSNRTPQATQKEIDALKTLSEGLLRLNPPQPSAVANHAKWLEQMANDSRDRFLDKGMDSLYAALIISAYTLFETLSEDLWTAAVNLRPQSLALSVLDLRDGEQKGQEKSVSWASLVAVHLDLREHMGTLLKSNERVGFLSFNKIEESYLKAFILPESGKKRKASNMLKELFDKYRNNLGMLENYRNSFAHRGGVVDAKYLAKQKLYEPDPNPPDKGTKVLLNGSVVVRYAGASLNFSRELLSFVDEWLCKYPT